jgi:hypothetical protein
MGSPTIKCAAERAALYQRIAECHAAGMTAPVAANVLGVRINAMYQWADARSLKWTSAQPTKSIMPVEDIAPVPDCDLDPVMCRALWKSVLIEQWGLVFVPRVLKGCTHDVAGATKWFRTRDCQIVCELAGVDYDFVIRRFQAKLAGVAA